MLARTRPKLVGFAPDLAKVIRNSTEAPPEFAGIVVKHTPNSSRFAWNWPKSPRAPSAQISRLRVPTLTEKLRDVAQSTYQGDYRSAALTKLLVNIGPHLLGSRSIFADLVDGWPKLAECGSNIADSRPHVVELGQLSLGCEPNLASMGRHGRIRANISEPGPNVAETGPSLADFGQDSVNLWRLRQSVTRSV